MLELLPQSQGNILGVRLTGKATNEDYEEVFLPALETLIREHGKVRCLYYMDQEFQGWTLGAIWDDVRFGMKHKDDFSKVAVVGGPKWAEWATKMASHWISAEIKTYQCDSLDDAWAWLEA